MITTKNYRMQNEELIEILERKFNIKILSLKWDNGNIEGEYE